MLLRSPRLATAAGGGNATAAGGGGGGGGGVREDAVEIAEVAEPRGVVTVPRRPGQLHLPHRSSPGIGKLNKAKPADKVARGPKLWRFERRKNGGIGERKGESVAYLFACVGHARSHTHLVGGRRGGNDGEGC